MMYLMKEKGVNELRERERESILFYTIFDAKWVGVISLLLIHYDRDKNLSILIKAKENVEICLYLLL